MRRLVVLMVGGILSYLAVVCLVLFLYEADPADMKWQERETYNAKQIGQLEFSMSKDDVIRMLGSPDISEAKETQSGAHQVLFYRTHHVTSDGITTKDECTPLLFRNNELVGWGNDAYQDYQELQ